MAESSVDVAGASDTLSVDGVQNAEILPPVQPAEADPVVAALHVAEDIYLSERSSVIGSKRRSRMHATS
jgi:hypothetical protein